MERNDTRKFLTQKIGVTYINYPVPSEWKRASKAHISKFQNHKYTEHFQRKKRKKDCKRGGTGIQHGTELLFSNLDAREQWSNQWLEDSRENDVQSRITYLGKLNCVHVKWSYFSYAGFQKLYLPLYLIRKLLENLFQIESTC